MLRKWLARLPHPFTPADRRAGYRYDISIVQAEFSLTQILDQPVGEVFFEEVVREKLDLSRPDRVSLIFNRRIHRGRQRSTPSRFRTTAGVLVCENRWAAPFASAARRAGGQLVASGRIQIQAILASLQADDDAPVAS